MSTLYSNEKDRTVKPARITRPKAQDTQPVDYSKAKFTLWEAPQSAPVPALFSATRPGVNPMTGEGW